MLLIQRLEEGPDVGDQRLRLLHGRNSTTSSRTAGPAADELASHCGAVRVAFNWGLAQVTANLAQREAERSYDIPDDQLTPALSWSMYGLRKRWNQVKNEVAPWWAGNSKEAYACGLTRLTDTLTNWRDSEHGKRKGPKMGFPRFKTERRATRSVRFRAAGTSASPCTTNDPRPH
jgi:transposase